MTCTEGNQKIVDQIVTLIGQLTIDQYRAPLPLLKNNSLGKHFRHIYDFYSCFFKGVEKELVDYTLRERNTAIETDPVTAIAAFQELKNLFKAPEDHLIKVIADFSAQEEKRSVISSNVGRELMFLHDHTVHHLAIISIGIREAFPDVELDEEVGLAPATIRFTG